MEYKEDEVIVIQSWQDSMMGVTFLEVLGKEDVYTIKLPSTLSNYKHQHLIRPEYLLELELVKTRKHWILKNVSIAEIFSKPSVYSDHILLSQMCSVISKLTYSGQETTLQHLIKDYLRSPLASINLTEFEADVLSHSGFLNESSRDKLTTSIQATKSINQLG